MLTPKYLQIECCIVGSDQEFLFVYPVYSQALSPNPQTPKPGDWADQEEGYQPPITFRRGSHQVPQGLSMTHPGGPGGQQDQGHGVDLHDQGEVHQQPISFMSVEEVSLYFFGGNPIPYFWLVPIVPRSSIV